MTQSTPDPGSQAEGTDPDAPEDERVEVLPASGEPSQAEGEDPASEVHEVLKADPAAD